MGQAPTSDRDLEAAVQAYYDKSGNKAEAARALGLKRTTYNDRLKVAERKLGLKIGKVADGSITPRGSTKMKLPRRGEVKRYLLTSIQNNTHLHPGFANLIAYRDWLDGLDNASCELLIGTYSYQISAYGPKAVKRGKHKSLAGEELWYAPEAEPYIKDDSVELAPGLVWCGEQNILPTAKHPLTGFEAYNGRSSNIVPHAKINLQSVAAMADEAAKFNYTTGTVTQMNYIQKRAGIMAEQEHDYGAALVEVRSDGSWWVRQLYIGAENEIMDVGPEGYGGVRVQSGYVEEETVTEAINWGDTHSAELERWVRDLSWGEGGMLDQLQPEYQFMNDLFSMRSRSHWDAKDFHRTFEKHVDGEETVAEEVELTADFLSEASRDWCETWVVPSNHDRHLDRWLNEADFRKDPPNARYFCYLQYNLLTAIEDGDKDFNILEYAVNDMLEEKEADARNLSWLAEDDSFVICKGSSVEPNGIECGLHGDLGPNGSKGTTMSLRKLGRAVNKGHDHQAAITGRVFSAGACSLDFPYMKGPHSHSISHIVTYKNGARAIVTMYGGSWRA